MSLETGAQYVAQKVSIDYSVSDLENNIWVQDDGLTNIFNYDQNWVCTQQVLTKMISGA